MIYVMYLKFLQFIIFADDTNIFLTDDDIDTLYENLNHELSKLSKWFAINKLSLNLVKTCHMLYSHRNVISSNVLIVDGVHIDKVHTVKFLGVLIDDRLSWKDHINSVISKLKKSLGVLYKFFLTLTNLL